MQYVSCMYVCLASPLFGTSNPLRLFDETKKNPSCDFLNIASYPHLPANLNGHKGLTSDDGLAFPAFLLSHWPEYLPPN